MSETCLIEQIVIYFISFIIPLFIILIDRYMRNNDETKRYIKGIITEIEINKRISLKVKEWFKKYEKEIPPLQISIISIPRFQTFTFDFLKNTGFIYNMNEKERLELIDMYRNLKICNNQFNLIHTILFDWVPPNIPAYLKKLNQSTSEIIEKYFDSKTDKLIKYFKNKLDCGGEG